MSQRQKFSIIIISVVLSLAVIGGALTLVAHRKAASSIASLQQHPVSKTELAQNDGVKGHKCYVAVSGTVYLIDPDSPDWKNGQHTTSGGLAYCGADLTKVIDRAPHGRGILDTLQKVGPLSK